MTLLEITAILGNVGEFIAAIAAIAVVVTLIYLSIQVKQSNEATEANTKAIGESRKLALTENFIRRSEMVERAFRDEALSEQISAIILKARKEGLSALDEHEHQRLRTWAAAQVNCSGTRQSAA